MPKMTRRKFLIGAGTIIGGAAAASSATWWLGSSDSYHGPCDHEQLVSVDRKGLFDVCIIGSGPAGTVLGLDLANRGLKTLIVESGLGVDDQSAVVSLERLDVYRSSGPVEYPVESTRFRGPGGTSNLWSGFSARLHPIDFEENSYTPEGCPWPISYDELEPYYQRAERTLQVSGGLLSQYHPPRKSGLPWPSRQPIKLLQAMLADVGVTVDDTPRSLRGIKGRDPVRVDQDLLPSFVESPHATLVSGATATCLIPDSTGSIVGVKVQSLDDKTWTISARTYVVACGTLETTRLLLLSRSRSFPDGIGNNHGLVGRNFMEHPIIRFWGHISGREFRGRGDSYQFYNEFKQRGLGGIILDFRGGSRSDDELIISAIVEMLPSATNRVTLAQGLEDYFGNPGVNLSLHFDEKDLETMEEASALIQSIYADLGAKDIRKATELRWSHHHMGCCRMGDNPRTSVTDRNLRVHDTSNLYLAGSAVFVTSGASNPTLAITALSHRLGDHLIESLSTDIRQSRDRSLAN